MFTIIYLLMVKGLEAVNIALGKRVDVCTLKEASPGTADGNRSQVADIIQKSCPTAAITIDLNNFYFVHSVVVYGGERLVNDQIGFGATISVSMTNGEVSECGKHLKRNYTTFHGMRVNCESSDFAVRLVSVFLDVFFYLAEIEVLTLASGVPNKSPMIYLGCFDRIHDLEETSVTEFDSCRSHCLLNRFILAAFKERKCYCANDYAQSSEQPSNSCNMTCSKLIEQCGGTNSFSVYLTRVQLPYYKGCIKEKVFSKMDANKHQNKTKMMGTYDMTVVKCLQLCDEHSFAALKNGVQCVCVDDTSNYSLTNLELCNTVCSEDRNSYCGGTNHWSVYGTCLKNNLRTLRCLKLFHCARSWDEYGVCEGGCESGYVGEHCIERESNYVQIRRSTRKPTETENSGKNSKADKSLFEDKICNPDPCKNKTNSFCYYNKIKNSKKCLCQEGYWNDQDDQCEDIDECLFETCDNRTSVCENLSGSFLCECNPGYFQITSDICIVNVTAVQSFSNFNREFLLTVLLLAVVPNTILLCYGWRIEKSDLSTALEV